MQRPTLRQTRPKAEDKRCTFEAEVCTVGGARENFGLHHFVGTSERAAEKAFTFTKTNSYTFTLHVLTEPASFTPALKS